MKKKVTLTLCKLSLSIQMLYGIFSLILFDVVKILLTIVKVRKPPKFHIWILIGRQ